MSVEEDYNNLKSRVVERKKEFVDFINFLERDTIWPGTYRRWTSPTACRRW